MFSIDVEICKNFGWKIEVPQIRFAIFWHFTNFMYLCMYEMLMNICRVIFPGTPSIFVRYAVCAVWLTRELNKCLKLLQSVSFSQLLCLCQCTFVLIVALVLEIGWIFASHFDWASLIFSQNLLSCKLRCYCSTC